MLTVKSLDVQWSKPVNETVEFPYLPDMNDRSLTIDVSKLEFQILNINREIDIPLQNKRHLQSVTARAYCGKTSTTGNFRGHYEIIIGTLENDNIVLSDGGSLFRMNTHLSQHEHEAKAVAETQLLRHLEILRVAGILPPTW